MSIPPTRTHGAEQRFSDDPPLPRWMLWLTLPGILAPLPILAFILFTQRAHDETRCPYHEVDRRELAPDVVLLEQARTCIGKIEEHRYTLLRAARRQVLGERRFDQRAFAADHYEVRAKLTAQGEAQVVVHNDGHDDVLFREGTARERAEGISLGHRSAAQAR